MHTKRSFLVFSDDSSYMSTTVLTTLLPFDTTNTKPTISQPTPMCSLLSPFTPPPPPLQPRDSLSHHRVFVVLGRRERTNVRSCIVSYDPSTNTWSRVTFIPDLKENHILKCFAMVAFGDSIYIIGGRLYCKERVTLSKEGEEYVNIGAEVMSTVMRYNVKADEWSYCAELGIPRYDFACTTCENKIYVAGGVSTSTCTRGILSAEMYDPIIDSWTTLPNMNTMRYKCVGVTCKNKVHVIGGFAERDDSNEVVPYILGRSSAEVYDMENKKWDVATGMWQLDVPPSQIVSVDGKMFSSSDCLRAWKGHVECFDGNQNIWEEVEGSHLQSLYSTTGATNDNSTSIKLLYLTIAPIGSNLYFFAGYKTGRDSSRTTTTVHVFDTQATNARWRSLEPVEEEGEIELCSHCCVVHLV